MSLWDPHTWTVRAVTTGAGTVAQAWLSPSLLALACSRAVYVVDTAQATPVASSAASLDMLPRSGKGGGGWSAVTAVPDSSPPAMLVLGQGHIVRASFPAGGAPVAAVAAWGAEGSRLVTLGGGRWAAVPVGGTAPANLHLATLHYDGDTNALCV